MEESMRGGREGGEMGGGKGGERGGRRIEENEAVNFGREKNGEKKERRGGWEIEGECEWREIENFEWLTLVADL